jgi:hypothetical protein
MDTSNGTVKRTLHPRARFQRHYWGSSHQHRGKSACHLSKNLLLFWGALPGSSRIRFRSLAPNLIGMRTDIMARMKGAI